MRFVVICICATVGCLNAGDIAGRIRITKPLTKKRVTLSAIYDRTSAIPTTVVGDTKPQDEMSRVVIYLENGPRPRKTVTETINQTQRRFEPEVIAVPMGSTVMFPNSDPIFHNIFSLSKTKGFDLGNYPKGQSRSVTFNEPGIVMVHCHLHSNMSAALIVTPTELSTKPDRNGHYELKGLPKGIHTIVAWHRSAGAFRKQVEVKESGISILDLDLPIHEPSLSENTALTRSGSGQ